jgi:hypothetical protein
VSEPALPQHRDDIVCFQPIRSAPPANLLTSITRDSLERKHDAAPRGPTWQTACGLTAHQPDESAEALARRIHSSGGQYKLRPIGWGANNLLVLDFRKVLTNVP